MSADIDIDLADREQLLTLICATPARLTKFGINAREKVGDQRRHNSGVYVTDIPYDPVNNCAAIDYKQAEKLGYFKIDLLNMSVYELIKSPGHYEELLAKEPPWERLWTDNEFASKLVHVGGSIHLLKSMKPDSIPRMAAFISIIRPGKAHLQNKPWAEVFETVWDGDDTKGFVFKKAHALGYSKLVALHMNLTSQPAEQG
jgi:uncharacterized protein YkuJ